jgi:hypothetical protein
MSTNGQVSKRTRDNQRRHINPVRAFPHVTSTMKCNGQQQQSLRFESLNKRKRTLELTSQRLICDKECLILQRKALDVKLALNENECERINIEKRRLELAIQKCHDENSSTSNGLTSNHHHSLDIDDHDDNSLDDMSDNNE